MRPLRDGLCDWGRASVIEARPRARSHLGDGGALDQDRDRPAVVPPVRLRVRETDAAVMQAETPPGSRVSARTLPAPGTSGAGCQGDVWKALRCDLIDELVAIRS